MPNLKPGDIVMHRIQYNRLCHLMTTRPTYPEPGHMVREIFWDGVRVALDNGMPERGWFMVPGVPMGGWPIEVEPSTRHPLIAQEEDAE